MSETFPRGMKIGDVVLCPRCGEEVVVQSHPTDPKLVRIDCVVPQDPARQLAWREAHGYLHTNPFSSSTL